MNNLSPSELSAVKNQIDIVQEHCDYCKKHGYPDKVSESFLKVWREYLPNALQSTRRGLKVKKVVQ